MSDDLSQDIYGRFNELHADHPIAESTVGGSEEAELSRKVAMWNEAGELRSKLVHVQTRMRTVWQRRIDDITFAEALAMVESLLVMLTDTPEVQTHIKRVTRSGRQSSTTPADGSGSAADATPAT